LIEKKIKILLVALGITLTLSFVSWAGLGSFADADKDGITDSIDNCPKVTNTIQSDFDGDKIGDECDTDDDNDGVIDKADVFDYDSTEWTDFDFDTIGDNADPDDDNDKIIDEIDAFDFNPEEWSDFDFDGVGKNQDSDDDNDGIIDVNDDDPTLTAEDMTMKYLQDIQDCAIMDDGTSRLLCYSVFFGKVAENEENNSDALELSIALSKLGAIDDCHFVSHEVGHVAFEENPNVIENLIGMDGSMCRGGYFHGVLASYFHDVGESGEGFPSSYNTICDELIGSSNYQDCIHGLGHGLVHYFGDDLNSSIELCHDMSFYQNRLCMKGVMMQYTDNILTRQGISKDVISNLCVQSELDSVDFQECSMSIGTTLAFFTNHDFDEGEPSCKLIDNEDGQKFCSDGLRLEIEDSKKYEKTPLTQEIREKFQPQMITKDSKERIIDIRSPAIISDFIYIDETKLIQFTFDRSSYIIMYIPKDILPNPAMLTVNGQFPEDFLADAKSIEGYVSFQIVPKNPGIVTISSVK